jgi:acyl carrier protein
MESLNSIVARVLNIGIKHVNDGLSRDESGWDSFNHLLLVSEIEKSTGVKFTASEIEKIKTFKDLKDIFNKKGK